MHSSMSVHALPSCNNLLKIRCKVVVLTGQVVTYL